MNDAEAQFLNGRVLACSRPTPETLRDLAGRGYRRVVNLTETRHSAAVLRELGLEELHVPVRDFTAPAPEQIVAVAAAVLGSAERYVIHCQGGLGRTGTVVACLLVASGNAPGEAIAAVRAARPGSVETAEQERAVYRFAVYRYAAYRYAATMTPGPTADV